MYRRRLGFHVVSWRCPRIGHGDLKQVVIGPPSSSYLSLCRELDLEIIPSCSRCGPLSPPVVVIFACRNLKLKLRTNCSTSYSLAEALSMGHTSCQGLSRISELKTQSPHFSTWLEIYFAITSNAPLIVYHRISPGFMKPTL